MTLHLNIGLIRLVLAGLNFCDEEVLALSEGFFDHLVESRGENRVDFTKLKSLLYDAFIVD